MFNGRGFSLAALLVFGVACGSPKDPSPGSAEAPPADRTVINLRAFAVLFGHVKYFHPSDEAARAPWDRLAVYGVGRVIDARDASDLAERLRSLFEPIAPTVQIAAGDIPPNSHPALSPPATTGLSPVAWQHRGAGFDTSPPSVYISVRVNRPRLAGETVPGCLEHPLEPSIVAGRRVRVRARIRSARPESRIHLWLASYTPGGENSIKHDLSPVLDPVPQWRELEFARTFPAGARSTVVGVCLYNAGAVEVDWVAAEVAEPDSWSSLPLPNADFSNGIAGWETDETGYDLSASSADGERIGRIERSPGFAPWALFRDYPRPGETVVVDLGGGLSARVPIGLWSKGGQTLPPGDDLDARARLEGVETGYWAAPGVGLAAVVVSWNAFQHFYPYFDVIESDWSAELDRALVRGLAARSFDEQLANLDRLVAGLVDGHGNVQHLDAAGRGALPFDTRWIDRHLVVTATADPAFAVGDAVVAVDGLPVSEWLARMLERTSGSPQWGLVRAARKLAYGRKGSTVALELERPDGSRYSVTPERRSRTSVVHERSGPAVGPLDGGIYYVDLERAPWPEIAKHIDQIASAPGVVFDLRGYPKGNHQILGHLLGEPDQRKWMHVPHITRPDRHSVDWLKLGWNLQPAAPRIGGAVVFLTDGRAISYAESVMGFVEGYRLGQIVGSETAGANGNVHFLAVPGGFRVRWTGMKVLRHDGERLHGIGIPPTRRARPTLAGFRAGRDEVLEAGLAAIEEKLGR